MSERDLWVFAFVKMPSSWFDLPDPIVANSIEANETIGSKDFRFRLSIAKKEAKETRYRLRLVDTKGKQPLEVERDKLIQESVELMLIINAILRQSVE